MTPAKSQPKPKPETLREARLRDLELARFREFESMVKMRGLAEKRIAELVPLLRHKHAWSWRMVGDMLGTSAQAAQQRYGK